MAKKTKTPALVSRHAHHTVTVQAGVNSKAIISRPAQNVNGESTLRRGKSTPTIFDAVTFAEYLEAFQRDFEPLPISTDARNLLDSMWKKDRRAAESALWAWAEWGSFCGRDGSKRLGELSRSYRARRDAVKRAESAVANDGKLMLHGPLYADLMQVIEKHRRHARPLGGEKRGRPVDPRNHLLHDLRLACRVYLGRVDPKLDKQDMEGWSTSVFKAFLGGDAGGDDSHASGLLDYAPRGRTHRVSVHIPTERSLANALARVRRNRKTLGIPID